MPQPFSAALSLQSSQEKIECRALNFVNVAPITSQETRALSQSKLRKPLVILRNSQTGSMVCTRTTLTAPLGCAFNVASVDSQRLGKHGGSTQPVLQRNVGKQMCFHNNRVHICHGCDSTPASRAAKRQAPATPREPARSSVIAPHVHACTTTTPCT